MRALFDTNVIRDVLLRRVPFCLNAGAMFELVKRGHMVGLIGATTVNPLFYIGRN